MLIFRENKNLQLEIDSYCRQVETLTKDKEELADQIAINEEINTKYELEVTEKLSDYSQLLKEYIILLNT